MRTDLALAALASAAVPGMKPVAVAGIAPSDDDRARELQSALVEDATGRRWVVRAPLTPMAGARLQRNDELVRQLSRHVPFKVPAAVGYAPVGKEGSAAVYPHVEGSPLDLARLPAGAGLASALGRALAAVHNIPRAVFEEQDVPVFDASGARQRAIAEVDRAAETGRVPTGLLARWEEAFEAAPLWQFATTPVHGSFTGASVVVAFTDQDDAATGRVVAVTDWDEAMVGDPAIDLAELWSRTSRAAWDSVLDAYALARAHRPDPYLHARARLVAELRGLRGLARAVAEGDEETARRCVEALRRMDRLTEADDSLVPLTARASGSQPLPSTEAGPVRETAPSVPTDVVADPDPGDPTTEVPAPGRLDDEVPAPRRLDDEVPAPRSVDEEVVTVPVPSEPEQDGPRPAPEPAGDADATMQIPAVPAQTPSTGETPDHDETPGDLEAPDHDETPGDVGVHDAVSTEPAQTDHARAPSPEGDPGGEQSERSGHEEEEGRTEAQENGFTEPEDLQDEERLQELYGMPAPDHDEGQGPAGR